MREALVNFDALDDFERETLTFNGRSKLVYRAGTGPGVIVMTEMPGISPHVARFARWVRDAGFTVYMPHLFGQDGTTRGALATMGTIVRACISAEFKAFAANSSSPVTVWLRALAAHAHQQCGGPGVGAIGMCFTGNFALSMMLDKSVIAPVLSQPSLPMGQAGGMAIAPEELAIVKQRLEDEDLTVLAYRFEGDRFCQAARFADYSAALGEKFEGHTLPDRAANPDSPLKMPHSVLTIHLIDRAGEPTLEARDHILDFFRMRLNA